MSPLIRTLVRLAPRPLRAALEKNPNLTTRRLVNAVLNKVEMRLGRTHLISRPYKLCIDVSNKCNLACPFCPTGRHEHGRAKGNVSFSVFSSIVDELAPYAFSLDLFDWGEPFFNPELPRLIAYAHRKDLITTISSNLSFRLSDDTIRAVIASGLSYLTASVDGADQGSYEIYRRGGKFELVIENLRSFVRLKREFGSVTPRITWQYLVFAPNENRVEDARQLAKELQLDAFRPLAGTYDDPSWQPSGDYSFDYLHVHENRCVWLWNSAVFHWDGGWASCCMGFYKHDDFAEWTPGAFGRLWNNEKFVAARRIWTEKDSPLPDGHYCTDCDKVRFYRGLPQNSATKPHPDASRVASTASIVSEESPQLVRRMPAA
ncbi:MAG: radical SAM protein [Deltaproteobacteria bacterium]|nr:radical SAM protein [Deltaproteobacteria bacterium]MBI3386141.1 radical SAM protein [Deltaproteobacteria bacterium]